MRVTGRTLRPSNLAERRLFTALGTTAIRVPRSFNPYVIARRGRRLAEHEHTDFMFLRELVAKNKTREPSPSPEVDTTELPNTTTDGVAP